MAASVIEMTAETDENRDRRELEEALAAEAGDIVEGSVLRVTQVPRFLPAWSPRKRMPHRRMLLEVRKRLGESPRSGIGPRGDQVSPPSMDSLVHIFCRATISKRLSGSRMMHGS